MRRLALIQVAAYSFGERSVPFMWQLKCPYATALRSTIKSQSGPVCRGEEEDDPCLELNLERRQYFGIRGKPPRS